MMDGRTPFFTQNLADFTVFKTSKGIRFVVSGLANTVENTEYFSLPDFPESRTSSSEYHSDTNIEMNQDSGNYSLPPSSSNASHGNSPPRKVIGYGKNLFMVAGHGGNIRIPIGLHMPTQTEQLFFVLSIKSP